MYYYPIPSFWAHFDMILEDLLEALTTHDPTIPNVQYVIKLYDEN